ncbi:MAG: hypothetical protein SNG35_08210 [Rikenellaceae bacterium]
MRKKLLSMAAIALATVSLSAQTLPTDKAARNYFKSLQSGQVTSTDYIDWHLIGPGTSGYCEHLWQHPTDPKCMIMSPDMHNTYGTWDGGESWTTVKDVDYRWVLFNRVLCLAFAPTKPDFGLALETSGELMSTNDRGRSWQLTGNKIGHHSAIAVDPNNEKIWFLGPGFFWNVKFNARTEEMMNNPEVKLRKKNEGYIYRSMDGGKTLEKFSNCGLPKNIEVGQIVVNPNNGKEVILCSNHGVYRSEDRGETWVRSSDGIPVPIIRDMESHYDPKTKRFTLFVLDNTAYFPDGKSVRSEGGVYRSDDGGRSWVNITGNLAIDATKITGRTFDWLYNRTLTIWFGISAGEVRNRFPEKPTSILSVYNRIKVNPMNVDEIYISSNVKHDDGFAPGDIWKSNDGGKTWFATSRSGPYWIEDQDGEYWASRNNPKAMNVEYAHMQSFMEDYAETFGNRFMEIGLDGTIYACIEQQMVRSTDGGKSWHQYDDIESHKGSGYWIGRGASNLPGRELLLETGIKDRILLCSGEHGLWQTNSREGVNGDKRVAVKQIEGQCNPDHHKGAHSIASVAVDPNDPNIIYTIQFRQGHRGFFRRSTDSGKSWENIGNPLPWDGNMSMQHIFQNSLLVDYKNPKKIYFCATENYLSDVHGSQLPFDKYPDFGVHRSEDGGFTWIKSNDGLPAGCSVRRLAMDPKDPNTLYAALNTSRTKVAGGLYRSTNGAKSWEKMKIPAEIESVNNIHVNRADQTLYISCGTPEGTLEKGGVWRSKNGGKSWEKIFFLDYVWQCETSPIDPNIITVVVAGKRSNGFNPGCYVSIDGAKSWMKVNKNLGQPNTITDFKPDPYDTKKFWAAQKGSGWAVGYVTK